MVFVSVCSYSSVEHLVLISFIHSKVGIRKEKEPDKQARLDKQAAVLLAGNKIQVI